MIIQAPPLRIVLLSLSSLASSSYPSYYSY